MVIIDEKGITARNLFKVIRKIKWEDVLEIKRVRIGYTPIDPKMSWFMFIDSEGGEIYLKSPFNWKGRYTKIKASKRNEKFIKSICPEIIFTDYDITDFKE